MIRQKGVGSCHESCVLAESLSLDATTGRRSYGDPEDERADEQGGAQHVVWLKETEREQRIYESCDRHWGSILGRPTISDAASGEKDPAVDTKAHNSDP